MGFRHRKEGGMKRQINCWLTLEEYQKLLDVIIEEKGGKGSISRFVYETMMEKIGMPLRDERNRKADTVKKIIDEEVKAHRR